MVEPLIGACLSRLEAKTDRRNSIENWAHSFKHRIRTNLSAVKEVSLISLLHRNLISSVDGWRVLKDFWGSDYQSTAFEVIDATYQISPTRRSPCVSNVARVTIEKFVEAVRTGTVALNGTSEGGSVAVDTAETQL